MQKEASLMVKRVAVYGTGEAKIPVKQRYWKRRKDGILQRFWKKTKRVKKKLLDNIRIELSGKGKDVYKAVVKTYHYIPKGYIKTSAQKFLENPEKFAYEGDWVEWEIESF
jgi:hypothetical protein